MRTVVYEYRPEKGGLGELTVRVNGGAPFKPLMGGGVRFVDTPANAVAEGELVSAELAGRSGPRRASAWDRGRSTTSCDCGKSRWCWTSGAKAAKPRN